MTDEWAERVHERLIRQAVEDDTFEPFGINVRRHFDEIQAMRARMAAEAREAVLEAEARAKREAEAAKPPEEPKPARRKPVKKEEPVTEVTEPE